MRLNVKKLRKEKNMVIVSSKESLKDINLIDWSKEVLVGNKKVEVKAVDR